MFEEGFEEVGWSGEAEVAGEEGFGIDDALDATGAVEDGTSGIAGFDGDGELEHFDAVHGPASGEDAGDDGVFEAEGVAEGDDLGADAEEGAVAEGEGGEVGGGDAEDGEVGMAIEGVDGGDFEFATGDEACGDGAAFTDDVEAGDEESGGIDDEAGADAFADAIAALGGEDDEAGAGGGGEFGGGA